MLPPSSGWNDGSMDLWNGGNLPQQNTASQHSKPRRESRTSKQVITLNHVWMAYFLYVEHIISQNDMWRGKRIDTRLDR
jgi:hypothetical protein